MKPLTPRQLEWLQCFQRLLCEHQRPPTLREWGGAMGRSFKTADITADRLERKGYLSSSTRPGLARSVTVRFFVLTEASQ